jgi:hypothetical protein
MQDFRVQKFFWGSLSLGAWQRRSEDYTGMQRGQTRFFTYRFLALRRTSRFREIQKRFIEKNCKMVNFCTVHGKKTSFLGGHELLFVHCVSKEPLILIPEGLSCDELECREVHHVLYSWIFEFADCGSPALVQIHSSCVFKVRWFI